MPVYMIRAGDTDLIKIGWADNDVEGRRQALQAGCWEELRIIRVIDIPVKRAEGWFHRHFSEFRVARDWFRFSPDMLTIEAPTLAETPDRNETVAEIFEKFGGIAVVVDITGATRNSANNWLRHDGIPFRHWPTLIEAAAKLGIPGINFETLRQTRNDVAA